MNLAYGHVQTTGVINPTSCRKCEWSQNESKGKKNGNIGSGNFEYGHLFLSITEREASLLGSS